MRRLLLLTFLSFCLNHVSAQMPDVVKTLKDALSFTENKGQFTGSNGLPVPFVLFKTEIPGADIYITTTGVSYVFIGKNEEHEEENEKAGDEIEVPFCRADMVLKNATISASQIEYGAAVNGVNNYYLANCPDGITGVKNYTGFTIKNIYTGIDWVWTVNSKNGLKYDFIVHPGADVNNIRMLYKWADVKIDASGSQLTFSTPLGAISEGELLSSVNGKTIHSTYTKTADHEIGFSLGEYDKQHKLTIDPPLALVWGTYHGGNGADGIWGVKSDAAGNIFCCGETNSFTFPTMNPGGGAYFQGLMGGGWDINIFEFNAASQMLWCTFYGGISTEASFDMAVDDGGNVYTTAYSLGGLPLQNAGGYYDGTLGGTQDAFVLKFNNHGIRRWATYLGGNMSDNGINVYCTHDGRLVVTGNTSSSDFPVLNPGGVAYTQATLTGVEAFISVFDTGSALIWSTLFGGGSDDHGLGITTDAANHIYLVGYTNSSNFPVVNPGGSGFYQGTYTSSQDGFITEFGTAYDLIWSTYYGNNALIANVEFYNGDMYICGSAGTVPQVNPGGGVFYQAGGGLFITRFDAGRNITWGTHYNGNYFWGAAIPNVNSMAIDNSGNIFMTAANINPIFSAGAGSFNSNIGGSGIVAFDNTNHLIWATDLGSAGGSFGCSIDCDPAGNVYCVGEMQTGSICIANPGGGAYVDSSWNQADDGFVVKFSTFNITFGLTLTPHNPLCNGQCNGYAVATVFGGQAPYSYLWSNGSTNDTAFNLCAGTYYCTATDNNGTPFNDTVIILQTPLLVAHANATDTCSGNNPTVVVTGTGGTPPYTGTGSFVVTAGQYAYTITDANGCTATDSVTVNVYPALNIVVIHGNIPCYGDSIPVNINGSGGLPPYIGTGVFNFAAGSHTVHIADANGCAATTTFILTQPTQLNALLSNVKKPCFGQANGTIQVIGYNGTSPYSYSATISGSLVTNTTGYFVNVPQGSYTISVQDANGCIHLINVNLLQLAEDLFTTVSDSVTCNGLADGSITVTPLTLSNSPFTYGLNGSSASSNNVFTNLTAGLYHVNTIDSSGCANTIDVNIYEPLKITVHVIPDTSFIFFGSSASLQTIVTNGNMLNYSWSPSVTLSCSTCPNTDATPSSTTWYSVIVGETANGANPATCYATDSALVIVETEIFVPNAFSPNGDGSNDYFYPINTGNIHINAMLVYNRWGQLVHEGAVPWDGTFNGAPQEIGVYVYWLEYSYPEINSTKVYTRQGNVALVK